MRKTITIVKEEKKLNFYLQTDRGRFYLFTQPFFNLFYQYFSAGKSERELLAYKKWNKNPRLDKTIEKIPLYIHYVLKEENLL